MITVKKNEATAAYRRMYFHCVDVTDGMTPETGEAGGQPQVSVNGDAFGTQTIIGVLVAIGNGRYYAELTQAGVNIADRSVIEGRYKSANTAESVGTTVQIVEYPVDISVATLALESGGNLAAALADTNELQSLISASKLPAQVKGIDDIDFSATMKASIATSVWNALTSGMSTVGSIGKKLADWVILTSQAIRDSMKLAPSAGDPAAGSVDKHLDDIQDDLDNPDQYKANVSLLATELNATANKNAVIAAIPTPPTVEQIEAEIANKHGSGQYDAVNDLSAITAYIDEVESLLKSTSYGLSKLADLIALLSTRTQDLADKAEIIAAIPTLGAGTNTIVIQVYVHGGVIPLPNYNIAFYDGNDNYLGTLTTDVLGQITTNVDSATFDLRGNKVGYTPDNVSEEFIVSPTNLTKTIYATAIDVGAPGSANSCRVFTYLRNQDDITIPEQAGVVATAKIKKLPYDYNGSLHKGDEVDCQFHVDYDTNGCIYWDLVWLAQITFKITDFSKSDGVTKIIPELAEVDLGDI